MKKFNRGGYTILVSLLLTVQGAVVPPPWADPTYNPCATQPGGWQLIYWPPDKKCYRIFSRGYPCPDTMELGPGPDKGTPECNCPPGSAQSTKDSRCYPLYQKEPCDDGEYFAPITITKTDRGRWGICQKVEPCLEPGYLLWPKDGRCYPRNSRGPCTEGLLLAADPENELIGKCQCENSNELAQYYWSSTGTCHEFYTTGPCQERGGLFLPGATCGCQPELPHYHNATGKCYQLGGIGPCPPGHQFIVPHTTITDNNNNSNNMKYAECVCKEGHIRWFGDGACYRPYTRGPCSPGNLYSVNITSTGMAIGCIPLPCPAGKLYFPAGNGCHRVGTPGPCPNGQVVLFQDSVKTSIEGISYLGMCGCPNIADINSFYPSLTKSEDNTQCGSGSVRTLETNTINALAVTYETSTKPKPTHDICGNRRGIIAWSDGTCKQLYTQGPCNAGEWVVPDRKKGQRKGRGWKVGKCECRPGYTIFVDENTNATMCQPPTVVIAKFLNNKTEKSTKHLQFKGAINSPADLTGDVKIQFSEESKSEIPFENEKDVSPNMDELNRQENISDKDEKTPEEAEKRKADELDTRE